MTNEEGPRGRRNDSAEGEVPPREAPLPLAAELAVDQAHLPGWLDREGEHVLIKDQEVVGFFPTRDDALMTGYTRFGIVPFLVKQILQVEPIDNVGHVEF